VRAGSRATAVCVWGGGRGGGGRNPQNCREVAGGGRARTSGVRTTTTTMRSAHAGDVSATRWKNWAGPHHGE